MAIENLAEKCRRRMDPEIEDTTDEERLQIIQVRYWRAKILNEVLEISFRLFQISCRNF